MSRRLLGLVATAAVLLLAALAGCTGKRAAPESLPAGDVLLKESATAMRDVKTVTFAIESDGTVGGLALRRAGGTLTREGTAKGTAQVVQFGTNVELEFVVIGDSIYLKGLTGGWQKIPLALASSVYDPSAILDPERGVPKLLSTATDVHTEAREKVGNVDAYRVAAKLNKDALSTLVPGITEDLPGQLWIAVDTKRLLKAKFAVPDSAGGKPANVTITFSEYDVPVQISAP
jgi:lipoprotein LprG